MSNYQCYLICSTIYLAASLQVKGWNGVCAAFSIVWALLALRADKRIG